MHSINSLLAWTFTACELLNSRSCCTLSFNHARNRDGGNMRALVSIWLMFMVVSMPQAGLALGDVRDFNICNNPRLPPVLRDRCASVPEPGSLLLMGAGLAGIGIWRRMSGKSWGFLPGITVPIDKTPLAGCGGIQILPTRFVNYCLADSQPTNGCNISLNWGLQTSCSRRWFPAYFINWPSWHLAGLVYAHGYTRCVELRLEKMCGFRNSFT